MTRRAGNKDWRQLIAWAEAQGWKVITTGGSHLRWEGPEGQLVFSASTPSDHRSLKNNTAMLRRAGLTVPATNPKKKDRNHD